VDECKPLVSGGWWAADFGGGGPEQFGSFGGGDIPNAFGSTGDFGYGAIRGPVRAGAYTRPLFSSF